MGEINECSPQIWHYSRLYWGFMWTLHNKNCVDKELIGDDLIVPKGLSDEDKFICLCFYYGNTEYGLTTKSIKEYFGWSKYYTLKIRKKLSLVDTITLIKVNGGYAGKGFQINEKVYEIFEKLQRKQHRSCVSCATCKRYGNTNSFQCPNTGRILEIYEIQHDYCPYEKLDTELLDSDEWNKTY